MIEGKYLAIIGIWIGVGLVGLRSGDAVAPVAFFGMLATLVVVSS